MRALRIAGTALGTGVLFVGALASGAFLHLDMPGAHRAAATIVTRVLASSFKGKIVVERIGHVGLDGVGGVNAAAYDPEGRRVLYAQDVNAKVDVKGLVRALMAKEGDTTIDLEEIRVGHLDVLLAEDEAGLSLPRVFESATPPKPSKSNEPAGRPTRIVIDRARIDEAHVTGGVASLRDLDVYAYEVGAHLETGGEATTVGIPAFHLVAARGVPPAPIDAMVSGQLAIPSKSGSSLGASFAFDGRVGELPLTASASIDGVQVHGVVDVRDTSPDVIKRLVPDVPLEANTRAHVEVNGTVSELTATADIGVGRGLVHAEAFASLSDEPAITARVDIDGIDPHDFVKTAPSIGLRGTAHAGVVIAAKGPHGGFVLNTAPAELPSAGGAAPLEIPALALHGELNEDKTIHARGVADERGAVLEIVADVDPSRGAKFEANVAAADLARVPRLAAAQLRGSANVNAQGEVRFDKPGIDATFNVQGRGIGQGGVHVASVGAKGRIDGAFDNLNIDANVNASDVDAPGQSLSQVAVKAKGPLLAPRLHASIDGKGLPHVEADAQIDARGAPTVKGARVALTRGDATITLSAQTISTGNGVIHVQGGLVEGLGAPLTLEAHLGPGSRRIRAKSDDFDVTRAIGLVGIPSMLVPGARATIDVDIVESNEGARGHAWITVLAERVLDVPRPRFGARLQFDGKRIEGNLGASVDDAAFASADLHEVTVTGSPLDPNSYAGAKGDGSMHVSGEIARIIALLPESKRPKVQADGMIDLAVHVARESAKLAPKVSLAFNTRKLHVATDTMDMRGIEGAIAATFDAEDGHTEVRANVVDKYGSLVRAVAYTDLPYKRLMADPSQARAMMMAQPFEVSLAIDEREIGKLPEMLGTAGATGTIALGARIKGTVTAPKVQINAFGRDVSIGQGRNPVPLDIVARAGYDARVADVNCDVNARGKEVLTAKAQVNVAVADILAQSEAPPPADDAEKVPEKPLPWDASAELRFVAFPLKIAAPLSPTRISAQVDGTIRVTDLHKAARMETDLTLTDIRVGPGRFTRAQIKAVAGNEGVTAFARVDQNKGFAQLTARTQGTWGAEIAPQIDKTKPTTAKLEARDFSVSAFLPFLRGSVDDLDGLLQANATLVALPEKREAQLTGTIALEKGKLHISSLGQELRNISARVVLSPDHVKLEKLEANAVTGVIRATGDVRLNKLDLVEATAKINIPKNEPIPLTYEGVPIGDIEGHIDIVAKKSADKKRLEVAVNIPDFSLLLAPASGGSVQPLDPDPTVVIGIRGDDGRLIPLFPAKKADPEDAKKEGKPIHLVVQLGNIVVRRNDDVNISVTGKPILDIGKEMTMGGEVHVVRGQVDAMGKRFKIERAIVSFAGQEVGNPVVVATAYWDAPDKTRVFADVTGPVKTIKVRLRSEPPLSENEIVALVLFGSSTGGVATPPPNGRETTADARAAGLGGGVLTRGLNRVLSGISPRIQTRVDTTKSQNPRPELEIQISEKVAVKLAYVLGQPPPGQIPERTFFSFDWRFAPKWSLVTTFGERGSTIADALWSYRY